MRIFAAIGLRLARPQGKEALALTGGALLPVAPVFTLTLWYAAFNYYREHKRTHCDVAWAREHLPWHYDHHMRPNPEANWCVTRPWFDRVLGTRKPFLGTAAAARAASIKKQRETGRSW